MPIRAFSRSAWALLGRLVRERRLGLVARKTWSLARTGDWRTLRDKARRTLGRAAPPAPDAYDAWMARRALGPADLRRIRGEIAAMARPLRFSVLMPVYDTDEAWLRRAIESVIAQLYPHWELCIADDASPRPHVRAVLEEYAARDPRVRVVFRPARGHISAATNAALALATGDFVALLDHDDEIAPTALHENARLLERHPDADMIYSDEDKLSPAGVRLHPHFKPDWSPELFASVMYTCHLGVYRTSLVREVGGMREGFEGSQDYDLVLRLVERTDRIHHIPSVLYHWRVIEGSTAAGARQKDYTEQASVRALTEHFARGGLAVDVGGGPLPNTYRVRHRLAATPLVSILIPTRDGADLLRRCVASILAKSTYPQYEIVVIANQSGEAARREMAALERDGSARVVRFDRPFNYAALNNEAVRHARGELLLFLNDDTEVIEAEWMEAMIEHALRPPVGAVGARLLYPDGRVQHGGVILGLGGVADHAHKHLPRHEVGYYGRARMIQNFSAVTAACLMMRRSVFAEVGGFDEAYTVAFNDVDLCLRLRERGYRIVWTPYAELHHHESATRGHEDTPDKRRRLAAEVEHLRRRWGAALDRDPYYSPHLTLDRYDFSLREPA
ncbi:MAG TPA: glycosyltransferase family 2 protein [Candidatus Limnocylindrales bacterium]|nr:glycosyltransferase family 2 protein [Candidatus Limnocylindrales bacterium]